jgi:hypothetical protein
MKGWFRLRVQGSQPLGTPKTSFDTPKTSFGTPKPFGTPSKLFERWEVPTFGREVPKAEQFPELVIVYELVEK